MLQEFKCAIPDVKQDVSSTSRVDGKAIADKSISSKATSSELKANPDVASELESISIGNIEADINNMTDEEIEVLLQQALKINQELKQELALHERFAVKAPRSAATPTLPSLYLIGSASGGRKPKRAQSCNSNASDHPTSDHPLSDHPSSDHLTSDHPTSHHPTSNKFSSTPKKQLKSRPEWNERFGY